MQKNILMEELRSLGRGYLVFVANEGLVSLTVLNAQNGRNVIFRFVRDNTWSLNSIVIPAKTYNKDNIFLAVV